MLISRPFQALAGEKLVAVPVCVGSVKSTEAMAVAVDPVPVGFAYFLPRYSFGLSGPY